MNKVYVTWEDTYDDSEINVVDFSTVEDAEKFIEENNLSDTADINVIY